MSSKTTGRSYRKGLSVVDLFKMFPDDATAEAWYVKRRWPNGIGCPHCGSMNVQTGCKHKSMPYRCREKECAKRFSAKTGTVMEGSKLGFQAWMIATYQLTTSLKSVSSMKLHRELNINQRSAWFLAHRLRVALAGKSEIFSGPVEVDESYFGGKRRNMSKARRATLDGRGSVGKTAVVGVRDRETRQVAAKVVDNTNADTLQGFVHENVAVGAKVYTDDASAYQGLLNHETVKHSVAEYVRGQAHTNGIESFWSTLKRAHKGTFHRLSSKHLHRYVDEFSGRHNMREMDTLDQMAAIVSRMDGQRLRYKDLVA